MTKHEAMEVNAALIMLSKFGNTKFKYLLLKNIEVLRPTITALTNIEDDIKKLISGFEKERNDLILRLGTETTATQVFIDMTNKEQVEEFNKELSKLAVKYKDEIDVYNKQYSDFIELKNAEVEEILPLLPIQLDLFPIDGVSFETLALLKQHNLIKE